VTGRTIRGPIADSPLMMVQYLWSGIIFRTVRLSPQTVRRTLADSPPGGRGQFAKASRTVRLVQCLAAEYFAL
jgi:hypothetical protein